MDSDFATRCPASCAFWIGLAKVLQGGDDKAIAKLLLTTLRGVVDCGFGAEGAAGSPRELFGGTLTSLADDVLDFCPSCPSVSCCVNFPLTALEALGTELLAHTDEEPTWSIFSQLAAYSLNVFSEGTAEKYYNNTVKLYGEDAGRADTGWVNKFFGNVLLYSNAPHTHAYRRVPVLASGELDFGFSVAQVNDQLKVGIVADWGCGNLGARRVLEELKKQGARVVVHLGDTYYSGTLDEQREYFVGLAREILGPDVPLLGIPGNHDYYSGGHGLLQVLDELPQVQTTSQQATFFALRGPKWQIVGLDTGVLDGFSLNQVTSALAGFEGSSAAQALKNASRDTLPFLPDDQLAWALEQIRAGAAKGLKTIVLSHHQLFSRRESLGFASGEFREAAFDIDVKAGVYDTSQWTKTARDLPGGLGPDQQPAANTRMLDQFPESVLANISAWFWGHEHAMSLFKPYAGLGKGRLVGNACIPVPKAPLWDIYAQNADTVGEPWGGHPEVLNDSEIGHGDLFWNLGFVTLDLAEDGGVAKYFELQDVTVDGQTHYKDAVNFFTEQL